MPLTLPVFQVKPKFETLNNPKKKHQPSEGKKTTIYGIGIDSFLN